MKTNVQALRPEVLRFAMAIQAMLEEIDPEQTWKTNIPERLYDLLEASVGPITRAIDSPAVTDQDGKPMPLDDESFKAVMKTTATLAARSLMIADVCGCLKDKEWE